MNLGSVLYISKLNVLHDELWESLMTTRIVCIPRREKETGLNFI